jgi:DNA-binding transcriptional MerR regulator
MSDQSTNVIVYKSSEVAEILKIGNSTLRKWCAALESEGYSFSRGANNSRLYSDKDIAIIRRLRELVQVRKMALETAANAVVTIHSEEGRADSVRYESGDHDRSSSVPSVLVQDEETNEKLDEILEYVKRQDERLERQELAITELVRQLEKRDKYIEERLEERDKALMASFRQKQEETQQLIAAAKEEEEQEQRSKGFWSKLFGK